MKKKIYIYLYIYICVCNRFDPHNSITAVAENITELLRFMPKVCICNVSVMRNSQPKFAECVTVMEITIVDEKDTLLIRKHFLHVTNM